MNAAAPNKGGDNTAIRPFRVNIRQEDLKELRRRIAATRWPERETVADQSQGHSSRRCRNSSAIGRQCTTGEELKRG
jgi:Epoxide hydrolase N terminus